MSKIPSPVLIIHGTEDEVIDFSHGLALFERCPKAVEPLWVEGAGHNDIELYSQYLERLRRFIGQEVAAQHVWRVATGTFWRSFGTNIITAYYRASPKRLPPKDFMAYHDFFFSFFFSSLRRAKALCCGAFLSRHVVILSTVGGSDMERKEMFRNIVRNSIHTVSLSFVRA